MFVKQGEETPQFWLVFETRQDRLRTPEIANEGGSVEGRPVVSLPKVPNDIIFGGIYTIETPCQKPFTSHVSFQVLEIDDRFGSSLGVRPDEEVCEEYV